jgi:hypothetical protein
VIEVSLVWGLLTEVLGDRALAKAPAEWFATMREFATALSLSPNGSGGDPPARA